MKIYTGIDHDTRLDTILNSINHEKTPIAKESNVLLKLIWGTIPIKDIILSCQEFSTLSKKYNIPLVFLLVSDQEDSIPIESLSPKTIIFRVSLNKNIKTNHEFVMPYVWEGIEETNPPLQKTTSKPIIGFCGLKNSHLIREENIDFFENSNQINKNFIIREQFWGGSPHNPKIKQEFIDNIKSSHFNLCDRGNGNFSMRFYQTLSLGRIPIISSINLNLPFENSIPYNEFIISDATPQKILDKILSLYESNNFINVQNKCLNYYNEFFSPKGFANKLIIFIQKKFFSNTTI